LRFKVLEERLKGSPSANSSRVISEGRSISSGRARRQSLGGGENFSKLISNGSLSKRTANSPSRTLRSNSAAELLKNAKATSRSFDGGNKSEGDNAGSRAAGRPNPTSNGKNYNGLQKGGEDQDKVEDTKKEIDDLVSGALYDLLQKEVIALRKACHEKDLTLKEKDDAVEVRIFLALLHHLAFAPCQLRNSHYLRHSI